MNKLIYLGLSVLIIAKALMYKFWYNYIKPKYADRGKFCYTNTESFVIYIKTKDFYKDIANNIEGLFHTSNYDENDERPLPLGKNKNVIGLFKGELGGKICLVKANLAKTYAYLMKDGSEHKTAKGTKKCII